MSSTPNISRILWDNGVMWSRRYMIGSLASLGILAWAPGEAGETIHITVDKLMYSPAQVSAHVGDTIEWANADFVAHTATGRKKEWDVIIPVKGVARVTLKSPGVIEYYCRFHPNMVGRITVAD
jgi:plastocyanin